FKSRFNNAFMNHASYMQIWIMITMKKSHLSLTWVLGKNVRCYDAEARWKPPYCCSCQSFHGRRARYGVISADEPKAGGVGPAIENAISAFDIEIIEDSSFRSAVCAQQTNN